MVEMPEVPSVICAFPRTAKSLCTVSAANVIPDPTPLSSLNMDFTSEIP